MASLNPVHFTSFYDKIDLGSSGAISLIGSDGVVRSSGGNAADRYALGQDLNGTKLFAAHAASGGATFEDTECQLPARPGWSPSARSAAIRCG